MKSNLIYFLLALITGALIPIQAATNAAFSKSIGSPYITGFMVFVVGLLGMTVFVLLARVTMPTLQQLTAAPAYGYLGGLIVATYVVMITILAPRIGVGSAIGFIVTGQIICAVIIDHFGLFNVAVRAIDATRFIGVLLISAGVYLVMKK
ncbi:MAG TPA: DMT family transporter [Bacteroidia bacterium]|nr:DMT family transporter [Bacteroidia bacterium]